MAPSIPDSPTDIDKLIDALASACGFSDSDPSAVETNGNQNTERADTETFSSQNSSRRRQVLEAMAKEVILDRGSVDACLESVGQSISAQRNIQTNRLDKNPTVTDGPSTSKAISETVNEHSRFQVQRYLAKGGIGQVSVALDTQLNREVAFKEIRPDRTLDNKSRSRFVIEAEVTGRLEHPGVVPVYSLGSRGDGLPYYAMRFIRGASLSGAIKNYHQQDNSSKSESEPTKQIQFRKLLQNFVSVCNTIHYAHDRGVVHRDIKPDNIMLGLFGETLVVDWGIAKTGVSTSTPSNEDPASADDAARKILPELTSNKTTRQGEIMGTPSYMSPEQLLGWQDRINGCSDVYSLGATLYTLLTGKPPFSSANLDELSKMVLEGNLESPRQVNPQVPAALESIALKAMAPKQSQRYKTPKELASDIEAWLADEETTAHRDPFWRRAKRWLKRHPAIASGATATIAFTLIGLTAGLAIIGSFNRKLEKSNDDLALANARQVTETKRAEQNFDIAQSAVEKYLAQVSDDPTLSSPSFLGIRTSLLETAIPFYETFLSQNPEDSNLQGERAKAMLRLARINNDTNDFKEAKYQFKNAAALFEKLAQDPKLTIDEIDAYKMEWQSSLSGLATVNRAVGDAGAAIENTKKALGILQQIKSEQISLDHIALNRSQCHSNLGGYYFESQDHRAALVELEQSVKLIKQLEPTPMQRSRLATSLANMGLIANSKRELMKAWELLSESFNISSELVKEYPNATQYRDQLANTLRNIALTYQEWNRPDDARDNFQAALTHRRWLATSYPNVPSYRGGFAKTLSDFGEFQIRQGQLEKASATLNEALPLLDSLSKEFPDAKAHKFQHALLCKTLGKLHTELKQFDEADRFLLLAFEESRALLSESPEQAYYRYRVSNVELNLGMNCNQKGDFEKAITWFKKSAATLESAAELPGAQNEIGMMSAYWGIAGCLDELGKNTEAAKQWSVAIQFAPDAMRKHVLQIKKAASLINAGNTDELAIVAERLAEFPERQSETFFRLARACAIYAATIEVESAEFKSLSKQCLAFLQQANRLGHFEKVEAATRLSKEEAFEVFKKAAGFDEFFGEL